jgi:hypothetical protein
MKKVIKSSIVFALFFTTVLSFANDFSTKVNDVKDNITNLTINNVSEGSILWIKDQNGLLIYKELIEKSGDYSKGFDLTALPNGDYSFELEKEVAIKIIPFEVKSNIVAFKKEEERTIIKPNFVQKNDVILVSKLVMTESPVEIKIYFENSDLVLEEFFTDRSEIQRKYDFSSSEKGNYKIVIKSEGRLFSKTIAIK